jgi:hypothetical protein
MTTFFRHHAITARTGAGILAAEASLDAHAEAPSLTADPGFDLDSIASSCCHRAADDAVYKAALVGLFALVLGRRRRTSEISFGLDLCALPFYLVPFVGSGFLLLAPPRPFQT